MPGENVPDGWEYHLFAVFLAAVGTNHYICRIEQTNHNPLYEKYGKQFVTRNDNYGIKKTLQTTAPHRH